MNMLRTTVFLFVASMALLAVNAEDTLTFDIRKVTSLLEHGQSTDIQEAVKNINSNPEHCVPLLPQLTEARYPSPLVRSYRLVLRHAGTEDLLRLVEGGFQDPGEGLFDEIVSRTEQRKKARHPKLSIETAGDLVIQLMKNGDAVNIAKIRAILGFRSTGWKIPDRGLDCLVNAIHKDEIVFQKSGTSVQSEIVRALWLEVPRIEDRLLAGLSHEVPEHRAGMGAALASPLSICPETADRLLQMADDESDKVRNHLAGGLRHCPHRVDDSVSLLIDYLKQPRLEQRRILKSLGALAEKASLEKQQAIIDAVLNSLTSAPKSDPRQVLQVVGPILPRLTDQQLQQRIAEWTLRLNGSQNVSTYLFLMAGVGPKAISAVPQIQELLGRTQNLEQQCQIA